jgi:hypothetical protein
MSYRSYDVLWVSLQGLITSQSHLENAGEGTKYMNAMGCVRLDKASIAKCHTAAQSKPKKL